MSEPIYQYRPLDENGELLSVRWCDCEADEYERLSQWPEYECRILYTAGNVEAMKRIAGDGAQAEAVAFALFTEQGLIRIWSRAATDLERVARTHGPLTPLYAAPAPSAPPAALTERFERIKRLALDAGGQGALPVPQSLRKIVRECLDGVALLAAGEKK